MAIPTSGPIKASTINSELGRTSNSTLSIDTAENGGYVPINPASYYKPSSTNPASYSEWRNYNHAGQIIRVYGRQQLFSATDEIQFRVGFGSWQTVFVGTLTTSCTELADITGFGIGDFIEFRLESGGEIAGNTSMNSCPASAGGQTTFSMSTSNLPYNYVSLCVNT